MGKRQQPRQSGWHGHAEFGSQNNSAIAKDAWDREEKFADTGLLDADGKTIQRRVKGMDPIGFVRLR